MEINPEYENNIKEIISSIQDYFEDADTNNDEEVYNLIFSSANETIARKMLDDYIIQHPEKTSRYIESKYLDFDFVSGGGGCDLINSENNIYYFEMFQEASTKENKHVSVRISISVDIENKKISNIVYTEIENTLNNL